MTHAAFVAWLLKIGMGWLSWDEETTLNTTIPGVILAYEGRLDMLKAIFGSGEKDKPKLVSMKDPAAVANMFRKAASKGQG